MTLYDEMLYYLEENGIYYLMIEQLKHKRLYIMSEVIEGSGVPPQRILGAYEISTKTAIKLCKLIGQQ